MNQPAKKRRNAEATRARLIEAGEVLFAEQGFDRTTLDAIAAAADVNKAMIRYYYGDKDGLYASIIESVVAEVLNELEARLPANPDPAGAMADYIEIFAEAVMARPSFPRMILRDYLDGDIMSREGPSQTLFQFMQTTRRYYQQGLDAGVFRPVDPHMLHLSIVSAAIFFSISARLRAQVAARGHMPEEDLSLQAQAFARHMRALVLNGISATADPKPDFD